MSESHERKLALAIAYLRTTKRGYVLDAGSKPMYAPKPADEPPRFAAKVSPIRRTK